MSNLSRTQRSRPKPSISDVARLAGVSAQTVSRVSTGAEAVADGTRQRVLVAMDQLGYAPNYAARALRGGAFNTIGLLADKFDRTGEGLSSQAVIQAADTHGYAVTAISVHRSDASGLASTASRLSHLAIDGLIVLRAEEGVAAHFALPAGLPVAVSDSKLIDHHPAVITDQVHGMEVATSYLLELGHATVHHLAGPPEAIPAQVRASAWRLTLERAGITPPRLVQGDWTPRSGYLAAEHFARQEGVTAVVAGNDEMAIGLIRGLVEQGLRVPDDISVIGFDDVPLAEFGVVPLTTVRQDFRRIGCELVNLVVAQIRGEAPPNAPILVPAEFVVRGSTAPPPRG